MVVYTMKEATMSQLVPFVVGLGTGYRASKAAEKETEIRQGKTSGLTPFFQASQIGHLSTVAGYFNEAIPNTPLRVAAKITTNGVAAMAWATLTVVEQGYFEEGVKAVKSVEQFKSSKVVNLLPDKLEKRTEKAFVYLAENLGPMTQTAMTLGAIALPAVTSPYLAAGLLAPIAYRAADSRGWVPRKVRLFIETYMPVVANVGAMVGGAGIVTQGMLATQVLSYSSTVNRFLQRKVDKAAQKMLGLSGPTIEEIDAPVLTKKNLSFNEINAILEAPDSHFTVNPAHCSKPLEETLDLPKSFAFLNFLDLFKLINWREKGAQLQSSFFDDERFIDYLKNEFPDERDKVPSNLQHYFDLHIQAKKVTKAEFFANRIDMQMKALIDTLNGVHHVEGSQKDLDEAIGYCAQILAYLQTFDLKGLQKPSNQMSPEERLIRVTLEDMLLKLGVEAGEYCALGVKRASKEIVKSISAHEKERKNPIEDYEYQLEKALERTRTNLVDAGYLSFINALPSFLKGESIDLTKEITDKHTVAIAQDAHIHDIYRIYFAFGVIPLSDYERDSMGPLDLNLWGSPAYPFRPFRNKIFDKYYQSIDSVFKEVGDFNFSNYLRAVIGENPSLTNGDSEEKEQILEKFTERNNGTWSAESTHSRFYRLVCVMLGILNYDSIADNWEEVQPDELLPPEEQKDPDQDWEVVK